VERDHKSAFTFRSCIAFDRQGGLTLPVSAQEEIDVREYSNNCHDKAIDDSAVRIPQDGAARLPPGTCCMRRRLLRLLQESALLRSW
jgi:hypothetical protein